ncbi:MAG: class I SAM-dependent methyltransferase [Chloroflexi bacterium]|nr:class I SAM-dependent methyltransferase [Chloroflexota bacterium]
MGNVWQDFFDYHAPRYLENAFTKDTLAEVDFLVEELDLPPGSSILDVGCGTGRHAVELARHGYRLTGVDISDGMLEQAARAAREAGVEVEWVHADAGRYTAARTPLTLVETYIMTVEDPRGHREVHAREKGYLPSELRLVLEACGFEVRHLWGGTAGRWGRRPIELDEIEIMAVARRA